MDIIRYIRGMEIMIKPKKDLFEEIEKDYRLNKKSLKEFLNNTGLSSLVPFFHHTAEHIKEVFGDKTKLELKVVRDPEGDFEQIFIYIHSDLPNEKISSKYDKVLSWFIKSTKEIPPVINISPIYH
jgi:methionine synthase II (cobalamin-independent)